MMTTVPAELRWATEAGGTDAGTAGGGFALGRGGKSEPLPRGARPGVAGTPLLMTAYGPLPELASVGETGRLARIAPAGEASVRSYAASLRFGDACSAGPAVRVPVIRSVWGGGVAGPIDGKESINI
jgi:hypothetical protein